MAEVSLRRWDGPEAARQIDVFLPAYEEVYVEPPYRAGPLEVADFIDSFQRQAQRPGFRLVLARRAAEIVGFAFGHRLAAGSPWWDGLLEPLPEEDFTRETGERTFAVAGLAVRKPCRRQGIAARLHAALLEGLTVERVTLTARPEPEAAPARCAYRSWGYRLVGRFRPWGETPVYDSMILQLR
ncbi:GNAT family N-acetyltransferase [Streptomyces sp. URMC 123]|uniref:GNAT family N-acetyltransferase n=1 Tax=Streptomyces sp. URMC 123 TaxID=3423403 RepID=UPI003F1C1226